MAVKNLKYFFLTLTVHTFFVYCKSVSVMTGVSSFALQPKLIWLSVFSFNYLLYDFNATRFQNFSKNFLITFVLVPLEILSQYPDVDIFHSLREDVQRIFFIKNFF